jgi:hypothetical protein
MTIERTFINAQGVITITPLFRLWPADTTSGGSMEQHEIMERQRTGILFLAGLASVIGIITWLDQRYFFFHMPYWVAIGILLGVTPKLYNVLRDLDLVRPLRVPLAIGIIWLAVLPLVPFTPEKAMALQAYRIARGMTKAQVQTIMAGYGMSEDWAGVAFCAKKLTVTVALTDGRVTDVRQWYSDD